MIDRAALILFIVVLLLAVGCADGAIATPDLVATEVAVHKAAMATLTAEAPTTTPTATPTHTPSATPIPEVPDENEKYYNCLFGDVSQEHSALNRSMSDMSYESACADVATWKELAESIRSMHLRCAVPDDEHLLSTRGYIDSAFGKLLMSLQTMELTCLLYDPELVDVANELLREADRFGKLANAELQAYYDEMLAAEVAAEIEADEEGYWDWITEQAEDYEEQRWEEYEEEMREQEHSRRDDLYEDWYYQQDGPWADW